MNLTLKAIPDYLNLPELASYLSLPQDAWEMLPTRQPPKSGSSDITCHDLGNIGGKDLPWQWQRLPMHCLWLWI